MSSFTVPDARQTKILRENHMDPQEYGVVLSGDDYIILLCYSTRCTIRIDRGDRKWA